MTLDALRTPNDDALRRLEPYLVAAPWHADRFERSPFGLRIPEENLFDPTRAGWSGFLDRLCTLDALTFGPEGMPMPRWLFYDASAIPGGIFGFSIRAERLTREQRLRLSLDGHATGPVPLSMYIAIPVRPPHTWYGHNLASLNRVFPELSLRGLATITKSVALRCFRCREQIGATQWDSEALRVHTKLGPLELLTAWTPAHADPATLTYRVRIDETGLRAAAGDLSAVRPERPRPDLTIAAGDEPALRALQARIEAGERFAICGPPSDDDAGVRLVPVTRL
jgi:hypothetical protein